MPRPSGPPSCRHCSAGCEFLDPQMSAAFALLPYRLRVVVVARLYLGWSVAQIATSLELPLRSTERRLRCGLAMIERHIAGQASSGGART